jgi:hypothetical protein
MAKKSSPGTRQTDGKNLVWSGEIERKLVLSPKNPSATFVLNFAWSGAKLSMPTFIYRSSSYLFYGMEPPDRKYTKMGEEELGCLLLHAAHPFWCPLSPLWSPFPPPLPPSRGPPHPFRAAAGHRYPCTHCVPALYKVNTRIPIENRIRPPPPPHLSDCKVNSSVPCLTCSPSLISQYFALVVQRKMHIVTGVRDQSEGSE